MKIRKYLTGAAIAGCVSTASAAVTINLTAGILYDAFNQPLTNGSLVQLVASTGDAVFTAPTASSFVSGDDYVLASFALNSNTVGGITGAFNEIITFDTNLNGVTTGDNLMLRWFPSLSASSLAPSVGSAYGEFRSVSILESSMIAWTVPADGTWDLQMLTASVNGATPDTLTSASFVTAVPEPATYAALLGLVTLGLVGYRRFRRS